MCVREREYSISSWNKTFYVGELKKYIKLYIKWNILFKAFLCFLYHLSIITAFGVGICLCVVCNQAYTNVFNI